MSAHKSFSIRSGGRSSRRREGAARNARRTHRLVRPRTSLFLQNVGSSDLEGRGGKATKRGGGIAMVLHFAATSEAGSAPTVSTQVLGCGLFQRCHVVVCIPSTPPRMSNANFTLPRHPQLFLALLSLDPQDSQQRIRIPPLHIDISLNCRPSQDPPLT